jgi:hypothetical protein
MSRFLILLVPLMVLACGQKLDPVRMADAALLDLGEGTVGWCRDIRPLFEEHCTGCHSTTRTGPDRNGAPVGIDFNTYAVAAPQAHGALSVMRSGFMPPDDRVPDTVIAWMEAWIEADIPE